MTSFQTIIDAAEGGNGAAGRTLWGWLATCREQGLDLSEMPAELVSWFDRCLEALTNVPAATRMGSRVTSDEAAELLTPEERTEKEDLAALCLYPLSRPQKGSPGRPKSRRKQIGDGMLAGEVLEAVAGQKRVLAAVGRGGHRIHLAPICRKVATRNYVSPKRVERAVQAIGAPARRVTTEHLLSADEASELTRSLDERGFERLENPAQRLRPGTYKKVPAGNQVLVRFLEP